MDWQGFSMPDTNYVRVPNDFVEALAVIDSLAELKVILYVMRHTWGFQEYDEYKKITTDEFMHGRMLKDRSRMDSGTGLSDAGVKIGVAKAIEHGFLECEVDVSDLARIKKSYRLKMKEADRPAQEPQPAKPAKTKVSRIEELRALPYAEYLQTPEWTKKRTKALRFAQFRCQLCNGNESLNVHHRTYERLGHELLSDLSVLCKDCHSIFHQNRELA